MGLRFSRRVTVAPGIAVNVSKSGFGLSVGPRGAKLSIGPRGMHSSFGLPGTGLSYRQKIGQHSTRPSVGIPSEVTLRVLDDGKVEFLDAEGGLLPPRIVRLVREQKQDEIDTFLREQCVRLNAGIDRILYLHRETPGPDEPLPFEAVPFTDASPSPFKPHGLDLLARLSRTRRERMERENEAAQAEWTAAVADWEARREEHERRETQRRRGHEEERFTNPKVMEQLLDERLGCLNWPRETTVSYQLRDAGTVLWMDIDLPEIEEMPREAVQVAARGVRLNVKRKSDTQVRTEYMQHVHAVLFRLIGEVFYVLPTVQEVVASGYSQRPDPATGKIRDDYLLSARILREKWSDIDFSNLPALDVVICFERFDLHRRMTRTGVFTPIEPLVGVET